MSIASLVLARLAHLGGRRNPLRRPLKLMVPMPDGVALETRVYLPRADDPCPTILMRVPYGIRGFSAVAEVYAERGYVVVLQACRGTGGSGGTFDPLVNERGDGLATLDWIKAQPWFDGRLGLSGPSYLGYAQWAISDALPPVSAMATKVTSAEFRSVVLPGGAFHLGLWLNWLQTIEALRRNTAAAAGQMFGGTFTRRTLAAASTLPLIEADVAAVGHPVPFWRKWFAEALDDPGFWTALDHTGRLSATTPPNHFVSGWHDFMLDQLLRDYATLVAAGQQPYLTIGSWHHIDAELQYACIRETVSWMDAQLRGDRSGLRQQPVRIAIGGTGEWLDFDSFPPPAIGALRLFPASGRMLENAPGKAAMVETYTYDPADPTPSVGGAMFDFTGAGPHDQSTLEARSDVLVFTSRPLDTPLTVIGNAEAVISVRAEHPHFDLFVALCDVNERGTSINVCDGLVRITPDTPAEDGAWRISLRLHATAHCFAAGHRLRLQVSSGAHPRFARNLGTGEHVGTATTMRPNTIGIGHGGTSGTALSLPVYTG